MRISDLESALQQFINQSFESISSIETSLKLLKKFKQILQRESLRADLESKYTVIFHNYGLELTQVQDQYEKFKSSPPLVPCSHGLGKFGRRACCSRIFRLFADMLIRSSADFVFAQTLSAHLGYFAFVLLFAALLPLRDGRVRIRPAGKSRKLRYLYLFSKRWLECLQIQGSPMEK